MNSTGHPIRARRNPRKLVWLICAAVVTIACSSAALHAQETTPRSHRQVDLKYYMPDFELDPSVPTPKSVLGYEVGDWHIRHDQIIEYFHVLAEHSPRVEIEEYARTHEQRPLILAYFAAPDKLAHREELRQAHLASIRGEGNLDDVPGVIWMGYSVHGNEPSGANAAVLFAYLLAAAKHPDVDRLLDECVTIIDPCLNPDGLSRFAHWANTNKSRLLNPDKQNREHHETWPGGRTNHYWFDLNRDWLLLTHPESRGRVQKFHEWRPNVLTDFHEMGTNSSYFFQPGVPTRQNPLTPVANLELTRKIAKHHARILDSIGSLYYTEESYDDFYYGKGSTYPDANGCIGILFEQASSRGHLQESDFGPLTFPFTIRNQFLTSLSSAAAGLDMRKELLSYQRSDRARALRLAAADSVQGYVFGSDVDRARLQHLVDILARHRIEVFELERDFEKNDRRFTASHAYFAPTQQNQYRLLKALFERRTEFEDKTFYDVSAWTLPLAFDMPFAELDAKDVEHVSAKAQASHGDFVTGSVDRTERPYAAFFQWHEYYAPRALATLLRKGIKARVATRPFACECATGSVDFDYGTIVVPLGIQKDAADKAWRTLKEIARRDGLTIHTTMSGLTATGIDLGSPSIRTLEAPKPLLVVGSGVSAYDAGEVWHLLDTRYEVELTMVELERFGGVDLDDYTHLIFVAGSYDKIDADRVRAWVKRGGLLIATESATSWAAAQILVRKAAESKSQAKNDQDKKEAAANAKDTAATDAKDAGPRMRYADYEAERAKGVVGGCIFQVRLDRTHPIAFGYVDELLPVFRSSKAVQALEKDPLTNVAVYTDKPLLAGYCSADNEKKIANTASICANRLGQGAVIRFIDNPNFRGVWYGTNKLFANALFFGTVIKHTAVLDGADAGDSQAQATEMGESH